MADINDKGWHYHPDSHSTITLDRNKLIVVDKAWYEKMKRIEGIVVYDEVGEPWNKSPIVYVRRDWYQEAQKLMDNRLTEKELCRVAYCLGDSSLLGSEWNTISPKLKALTKKETKP